MSLEQDLQNSIETIKNDGIGYYKLKEGDSIYRVYKKPNGEIDKVIKGVLENIIINFNGNDRLFDKRIKISGQEGDFSIKKFKKFLPPAIK